MPHSSVCYLPALFHVQPLLPFESIFFFFFNVCSLVCFLASYTTLGYKLHEGLTGDWGAGEGNGGRGGRERKEEGKKEEIRKEGRKTVPMPLIKMFLIFQSDIDY